MESERTNCSQPDPNNEKELLENLSILKKQANRLESLVKGFSSWISHKLITNQEEYFKNKPTLGAPQWNISHIYFIPEHRILVFMDDGHIVNVALCVVDEAKQKIKTVVEVIQE